MSLVLCVASPLGGRYKAVEAYSQMDLLIDLLKKGEYWIAVAVLAVTVLLHLPKLTDFFHSNRKKRSLLIQDALSDVNTSSSFKKHLLEEAELEQFRLIHGVRLSTPMFNAVFEFKNRVGSTVSFRHILKVAKVQPELDNMLDISYRIRLGRFDKAFALYNLIAGLFCLVIGLVAGVGFLYFLTTALQLSLFFLSILGIMLGVFLLNEGGVLISVHHINRALEQYERNAL
ncbi:hypothetical protein CTB58_003743 [Vibrio mimicus]